MHVLLIAGVPIKEPIVKYGPFVMNTEDEIRKVRLGSLSLLMDNSEERTMKIKQV